MATSLPQVVLPSKQWVDLYAESGISVGTKILVQNTSGNEARLVESAAKPTLNDGFNSIVSKRYLTSAPSPIGAWAYAHAGTTLQVEEAL